MNGKPRIKKNRYDNWYGYLGTRKVISFFNSREATQEQQAHEWLENKLGGIKPCDQSTQ